MKTVESIHPQPSGEADAANVYSPLAAWQTLVAEARQHPWLLRLALRQGAALLERFVQKYQELLALSRQRRRALLRQAGMGLAGVALLLAMSGTPAFANSITVNGDGTGGTCSLIEAIQSANDTSSGGDLGNDCATADPTGADTITLTGNVDLTADHDFYNGLPPVTSEIVIEGNSHTRTITPVQSHPYTQRTSL
jgi:hypothetical protein